MRGNPRRRSICPPPLHTVKCATIVCRKVEKQKEKSLEKVDSFRDNSLEKVDGFVYDREDDRARRKIAMLKRKIEQRLAE